MLEPFTPLYSPGALRLRYFEANGDQHLLTLELRRTLDQVAAAAPARIASGRSTQEEAQATARLWLAMCEDLEAQTVRGTVEHPDEPPNIAARCRELRAKNGVAWTDKVAALRAEIGRRRAGYPGLVDQGRLTADDARQQLERLEAVHDLYWRGGYAFDGTRDELRALSTAVLDHDVAEQGEAKVEKAA